LVEILFEFVWGTLAFILGLNFFVDGLIVYNGVVVVGCECSVVGSKYRYMYGSCECSYCRI